MAMQNVLAGQGGAYTDGAVAAIVQKIGQDVTDIKQNMVYRAEFSATQQATNQRLTALENSPASMRDWLSVMIAGAGCLGSIVMGMIAIIVTIYLASHH